jgi:hypothetical protein
MSYEHVLTPAGTVAALAIGLIIDYLSVGPTAWRDRIAWIFYFIGFAETFGGSIAANRIFALLNGSIGPALQWTQTYVSTAEPSVVAGMLLGGVVILTLGAMAPSSAQKWIGDLAKLGFGNPLRGGSVKGGKSRLNYWMIFSACSLGLMHPYIGGLCGQVVHTAIAALSTPVDWAIVSLFGGA